MALAAQNASDRQDDAGPRIDAPLGPHRLDALWRHRGGIKPGDIDMGRRHYDTLGGDAVALGDRLGDLVAHGDDPLAARHPAVVEMLEDILLAKSVVPGGHQRYSGHAGSRERAPGRSAGERMHGDAAA